MSVDYTMAVTRLDAYPEADGRQDMVFRAYWTLTATDGSSAFTYPGKTEIPYNPDAVWHDYAELTQDEVLQWVSTLSAAELTAVRASLALNFSATPIEDNQPLPW